MYVEAVPNRDSPPAILPRESYREGTVNLSAVNSRLVGQGAMAIYIVAAMLLISAQTRNVRVLAALSSAAVT